MPRSRRLNTDCVGFWLAVRVYVCS